MKQEEQITNNWNKLIEIINNNISDDRKDKLLEMYGKTKKELQRYMDTCEYMVKHRFVSS